ncbi:MAG: YkgJ family cysteine cluster protein [Vampirovibrio sp.]|nr:YkgJ family cysteine cluster protein [Vampirovibrio sp.]
MSDTPDPNSPLGYANEVERLLKMPQHLCKQRGICCRVATFKGNMGIDEIRQLAAEDTQAAEMARDFLSIFLPYESEEAVREVASEFVDRVREKTSEKNNNPDNVTYFHCKFVLEDGRCGVHEDRPIGCRTYPFPYKDTLYHPGCGFEQQGKANWQKIQAILDTLGLSDEF